MVADVSDEGFDEVVQLLALVGVETQVEVSVIWMVFGHGPLEVGGQDVPGDVCALVSHEHGAGGCRDVSDGEAQMRGGMLTEDLCWAPRRLTSRQWSSFEILHEFKLDGTYPLQYSVSGILLRT